MSCGRRRWSPTPSRSCAAHFAHAVLERTYIRAPRRDRGPPGAPREPRRRRADHARGAALAAASSASPRARRGCGPPCAGSSSTSCATSRPRGRRATATCEPEFFELRFGQAGGPDPGGDRGGACRSPAGSTGWTPRTGSRWWWTTRRARRWTATGWRAGRRRTASRPPSTCWPWSSSSASGPWAGFTWRWEARTGVREACWPRRVDEIGSGFVGGDLLPEDEFAEKLEWARERIARDGGSDAPRRAALHAGEVRLERRLRLPVHLPERHVNLTEEQLEAVERRDGPLMVRAGAGTGKTTVLVERFVRAVVDDAVPVESMLAITFTDKAAAEMRTRVRAPVPRARAARGGAGRGERLDLHDPRVLRRLLRAHALSAGIDPDFRLLEELEAERLAVDAFDRALEDFLGVRRRRTRTGWRWWPSYTPDSCATWCARPTRSCAAGGAAPALSPPCCPAGGGAPSGWSRRRARRWPSSPRASLAGKASAIERCLALPRAAGGWPARPSPALAELELTGSAKALCTAPAWSTRGAHGLHELCVARREHPDRELLRRLLDSTPSATRGQAGALGARLRGSPAAGSRPARGRRRAARALRDPLRARAGGRVPGREPAPERADRADRAREPLPRGRREPVDLRLPPRRRRVFRNHRERAVAEGRARASP